CGFAATFTIEQGIATSIHLILSANCSFPLVKSIYLWNFARLFPQKLMAYAIIKTGGRQYRVAEGDTIDVDLLPTEAGKQVVLSDVLFYADGENVTHGTPIDGAKVTAQVVEQRKDKKIIAFKFKRRKGYHRT